MKHLNHFFIGMGLLVVTTILGFAFQSIYPFLVLGIGIVSVGVILFVITKGIYHFIQVIVKTKN